VSKCIFPQDSGGDGGDISRPISPVMKRDRNIEPNNADAFECYPIEDNFKFTRKKTIVPEAELSDPKFLPFENSFQESSTIESPNNSKLSLRKKLSSFARLLISSPNRP